MVPDDPQTTYEPRQVAEFSVVVFTHHMGHFEFRLCDQALDGGELASAVQGQACLDHRVLLRAPPATSCAVDDADPDCQPVDVNHPERWYLPPSAGAVQQAGADWQDEDGRTPNGFTEGYTMRYQIPSYLSCTHCTLQWHWATGNSCFSDEGYYQYFHQLNEHGWNGVRWFPMMAYSWFGPISELCGPDRFPEEFWNCADIAVLSSSSGARQGTSSTTAAPTGTVASSPTVPLPATQAPAQAPTQAPTRAPVPTVTAHAPGVLDNTGSAAPCAGRWQQCGGRQWTGAQCCAEGLRCVVSTEWYWQCRTSAAATPDAAVAAAPTLAPASTTTPPPAPATGGGSAFESNSGACAAEWGTCGGMGQGGPTCCELGLECVVRSHRYSQCRAPALAQVASVVWGAAAAKRPAGGAMPGRAPPASLSQDAAARVNSWQAWGHRAMAAGAFPAIAGPFKNTSGTARLEA